MLAKRLLLITRRLIPIAQPPIIGRAHPGRRCNDAPVIVTIAALLLMLSASAGLAQTVDTTLWNANGTVRSFVRDGGTIYIGGDFTQVGPTTGACAVIDGTTGAPQRPYMGVVGRVYAVAADGAGGWYLGGSFSAVRGQPRNNLAQVDAGGNLTAWDPDVRGPGAPVVGVFALAVSGATVYVGGSFYSVHSQGRNFLAAVDATTGAPTAWTPSFTNGLVNTLVVSGGMVYAGGNFTSIGGQPRNYIAALDAASGLATAWNPGADHPVGTLAVNGAMVYAGGNFTNIGGQARNYIAALDAATGAATPWDANANSTVAALAVNGGTLFVGGCFNSIGGQSRQNMAELDAASGAATAWNPSPNACVSALLVNGSTVYAGGAFTSIGAQPRNCIAALDAGSGAVTGWSANAGNVVRALAVSGGTVCVGGDFTSVGGLLRKCIAALDAASGAATPWNPNANNTVRALAVSGGTVYAGGSFTTVGGQPRQNIAAIDAVSGAVTPWNPGASSLVRALVVSGSTIYVGDASGVSAVDTGSGAASAWRMNTTEDEDPYDVGVSALAVFGGAVYVGGYFASIGGAPRYLVALDAASGANLGWNLHPNSYVEALAVSGGTLYVGGWFDMIGGQPRNYIAAFDAANGVITGWNPYFVSDGLSGPSVWALAVNGAVVYASGSFGDIGGQTRNGIAALEAASGAVTTWNPDAIGGAYTLAVSGNTVYAGGGFGVAAIHNDAPTATLLAQFDATTTADGTELRWSFGDPSRVATVAVERAVQAAGPWMTIEPELEFESGVTLAIDRTAVGSGEYFYRLVVQLTDGSHLQFGPVSATRGEPLTVSGLTLKSPNPTPGQIHVQYAVARAGQVRLEILDVSGRIVATLADRTQESGRYEAAWDRAGRRGQLPPGLYFVRFVAPDFMTVRKLAVVR